MDFSSMLACEFAKQVAEKIYHLDITGKLKNGLVLDIRNV